MYYFLKGLRNGLNFKGRASRAEFWHFILVLLIGLVLCTIIGTIIRFYYLGNILVIITCIPTLALGFRRMQDTNLSGWHFFIPIFNIVQAMKKGDDQKNQYGVPPK